MRMVGTSLAVALCLLWAQSAMAKSCGSGNCSRRGNCGSCGKSCQVTCGTKTVKKTVWVVECEEFCAPLPNCDRCRSCNRGCKSRCKSGCEADACGDCGSCGRCCKDPCQALQNRKYVTPKCSKVRTRKKLVKKTVTCEIPVYKCVLCGGDAGCCGEEEAAPAEAPADDAPEVAPPAPQASSDYAPRPPVIGTSYLTRIQR